jgi:hypothetical protein
MLPAMLVLCKTIFYNFVLTKIRIKEKVLLSESPRFILQIYFPKLRIMKQFLFLKDDLFVYIFKILIICKKDNFLIAYKNFTLHMTLKHIFQ